jgi:two-component system cell cycle response regulator
LGRYGGEEFSIILPETTSGQALEIAERLRANMAEQPIKVDQDTQLSITISLGVSESSEKITSLSSLLNRADSALYGAKQAGRNKVMLKS